jgi:tetratricopeptide (TPR) repeat protein
MKKVFCVLCGEFSLIFMNKSGQNYMKISTWPLWLIISMTWGCVSLPAKPSPQPPDWVLRVQGIKQPEEKSKAISSRAAQESYLHGMNFYQRGLYQPAIERLTSAIEQDKTFVAPYMALGEIYCLTQQTYQAEVNYKRALELDPGLVEAWVGLGILYWERGDYELAHKQLFTALEIQPHHPKAKHYLELVKQKLAQKYLEEGMVLRDSGRWEQALPKFHSAIQYDPQLGEAYLELARLYIDQQQYQPAVDELEKALAIMPEVAAVWHSLGQAYLGLYEYDRARKALQRSLILDPRDQEGERLLRVVQQELYRDRPVPAEFLKISSTPAITRGQLAALLALNVRLPRGEGLTNLDTPVIIPDISSHWAQEYIIYVVRNQLMMSYPNHYFLPDVTISRGELADIIDNVLQRLTGLEAVTSEFEDWGYEDVSPENQYYGAVTRMAALGIIPPEEEGVFGLTHKVSGLEALEIVDRLADFIQQ